MSEALPVASSLRQVLGAMIFSADRPVSAESVRKCLQAVAETDQSPPSGVFAQATLSDIREAVEDLRRDLLRIEAGFEIVEVAGGYRLRSQPATGRWVRHLLNKPMANRLSPPAIETLAIIAYRQPIPRAEIESIRGVAVGHVLRALIELRLVRIAGRSDLPGRPFLYGTTTTFLEHFGLKKLSELEAIDPTLLTRHRGNAQQQDAQSPRGDATEAPPDVRAGLSGQASVTDDKPAGGA